MGYDSIVCVKQVPDTANITGDAMKADGTVNRGALPAVFNPDDLHALEAALQIRDRFGGTVTAITMGPMAACEVLRECLYRGADRVILISDRRAAASDTLATSYILSQAVRKIRNYDLVFAGRQAIDGDTAQVGPQLAEKLGLPQITYYERLADLSGKTIRVRRNVGNGYEVLETRLPALLTVLDTANETRPAAAKRVMKAKRVRSTGEIVNEVTAAMPAAAQPEKDAEVAKRVEKFKAAGLLIEQWNLDDIAADLQWCGMSGSPTKVHRVQSIVLSKEGYTEVPNTEEGIRKMVHELIVDHTLG
ncbi:MAG: electron transfer flavoprotein subunit beta/FixA family protein [Tepidisphaerales bacterium]